MKYYNTRIPAFGIYLMGREAGHMEKCEFSGWHNCYRLTSNKTELVVTTDIGPRIIRFGHRKGKNVFKVFRETQGKTGGNEWRMYGGHRLWHAPESFPETYQPDNAPVTAKKLKNGLRLIQPAEPATGIQKQIDVRCAHGKDSFLVTHYLRNNGHQYLRLAPWAISVMEAGGRAIVPLPPRAAHDKDHLLPTGMIALWRYTDMADPRWYWGARFVMLSQKRSNQSVQKAGLRIPDGWIAYAWEGLLFVRTFRFFKDGEYPDFGCSVELFTDDRMLELEVLGPLQTVKPGETAVLKEQWFLFSNVLVPENEKDIGDNILPIINGLTV